MVTLQGVKEPVSCTVYVEENSYFGSYEVDHPGGQYNSLPLWTFVLYDRFDQTLKYNVAQNYT